MQNHQYLTYMHVISRLPCLQQLYIIHAKLVAGECHEIPLMVNQSYID